MTRIRDYLIALAVLVVSIWMLGMVWLGGWKAGISECPYLDQSTCPEVWREP